MPLIGVDRFAHELQEQTLVKGAFAPELLDSLQPVYPVGLLPDCDDRVAWWYTPQALVAAVAAQFSTIWLSCASGRAIVDGITILNTTAATTYAVLARLGSVATYGAPFAAAFQSNPYSPRAGSGPAVLAPLVLNTGNAVGGRLAGIGYTVEIPVTGTPFFSWRNGSGPGWIIDANTHLVVESNAVNQQLQCSMWGRWLPEALVQPS